MEPTMIKIRVLSTVAAIALVLPMAAPGESFAQHFKGGGRGGVAVGGGGGAPAARFSGGAAPLAHYHRPGASSLARYSGVSPRRAPAARLGGAPSRTRLCQG